MNRQALLAIKVLICIVAAAIAMYAHIDHNNSLTEIRREIPVMEKRLKEVELENIELQYEVDRFESPIHLMELSRKPEFGHLKYPYAKDVLVIPERRLDE